MYDGVYQHYTISIPHEDKVLFAVHQPSTNLILERNNELRKNAGAINDLGKGSNDT